MSDTGVWPCAAVNPRPGSSNRPASTQPRTATVPAQSTGTATVTAFVERGLAHFAGRGIETKRLISDNAFVYRRNRSLRELLERHGIRHLLIPIRRPQVNGKVCVSGSRCRPPGRRGCPLPLV